MVIYEKIGDLYHAYSNEGLMIRGGDPAADYDEAFDVVQREYTEVIPEPTVEEKAEAYDIVTGGAE